MSMREPSTLARAVEHGHPASMRADIAMLHSTNDDGYRITTLSCP